jgi:hypothetical protein
MIWAVSLYCALFAGVQAANICVPYGPVYPAPRRGLQGQLMKQALERFANTVNQSLSDNGTIYGNLDPDATSFGMEIYSIYAHEPLYSYHYSAPEFVNASEGVRRVNASTVYRLGSMSKLLSVYNFLIAAGDSAWNEPVTKFVPELAQAAARQRNQLRTDDIEFVSWDDVTLAALASQMSGVSREDAFGPVQDAQLRDGLGLPDVAPVNASFCGPTNEQVQDPCTRAGTLVQCGTFATRLTASRFLRGYFRSISSCSSLAHAHILECSFPDPIVCLGEHNRQAVQPVLRRKYHRAPSAEQHVLDEATEYSPVPNPVQSVLVMV